jgi:hypothetical protein
MLRCCIMSENAATGIGSSTAPTTCSRPFGASGGESRPHHAHQDLTSAFSEKAKLETLPMAVSAGYRWIGKFFENGFERKLSAGSRVLPTNDGAFIEAKGRNQPIVCLVWMNQNRPRKQLAHDVLAGAISILDQGILSAVKLGIHVAERMETVTAVSPARGFAELVIALIPEHAGIEERPHFRSVHPDGGQGSR